MQNDQLIKNRYLIIEKNAIGRGSFSRVYLGLDTETDQKIAIKKIDIGNLSEKYKARLQEEVRILKMLDHPNIVKTYDIEYNTNDMYIYIMMELCGGGDFAKFLKYNNKIKESKIKYYMYQLMRGLEYLRAHNIVHRDLKPANLLLSEDNYVLKLTDFGFARDLPDNKLSDTLCGSPLYMAPELFFDRKYNSKSDLWSIGVMLYHSLYGRNIFPDITSEVELIKALKTQTISYPKNIHLSSEALNLLHGLLQKDPIMRISWPEFFTHVWWLTNVNPSHDTLITLTSTVILKQSTPISIPRPTSNVSMSYSPQLIEDYTPSASPSYIIAHSDDVSKTFITLKRGEKDESPSQSPSTLSVLWNVISSSLKLF